MSVDRVSRDLLLLHPIMRDKVGRTMADIDAAGLPLRVFEAWRSPERQRHLYAQGRTRPGRIITYAQAWESYHQYGLAADIVGHVNGGWTWDLPAATWTKMHAIGRSHGLERLGFETPHLQVEDLQIGQLADGDWPEGGDASWFDNLSRAIDGWSGHPEAPPIRGDIVERPSISTMLSLQGAAAGSLAWNTTPPPISAGWHDAHDGQEWRLDAGGVYLRSQLDTPLRTSGSPTTCQTIIDLFAPHIHAASLKFEVPPELIVMTIATETAFARRWDFTGPRTFRWEPHVEVKDVEPPTLGDYSAGPMQCLATTARDVIKRMRLPYDAFAVAPYYALKPDPAPATHPLYEAAENVTIGVAEIASRLARTGLDPILVAAAYNAGGLYRSTQNVWHLRSHGDHLDRASKWYGDACFVLASLRG